MAKHKTPAGKRADKAIKRGKQKVGKADKDAQRARDHLRRKYSVPDKTE